MIYVAGSINLDLIARVQNLPAPGQTINGQNFMTAPGGKGANQALAAKRAGGQVKMIGAVGKDANASQALSLLEDAGIDLSSITYIDDGKTPTGVALILVAESSGENQIAVIAGANGILDGATIARETFTENDYVVLQMEVPAQLNQSAMDAARKASATSILNIAPYGEDAVTLSKLADYTIANETEFDELAKALSLAGDDYEAKAANYFANTGKNIVITLGAEGAIAVVDGTLHTAKAPEIKPVDTVGAGDTFCGAFAVALSEGKSVEDALLFGCAAGAFACLKHGAQPSIPLRADIDGRI